MIEILNVVINYKNKDILIIDSLTIEDKGIRVIAGDNGSGKTSLIKSILNINKNYAGIIKINGADNKHYSRFDMAKLISYLPQTSNMEVDITAGDFIKQGLYAVKTGFFNDVVELLYLKKYLDKNFLELSGGEKQLCRIARAMIPDVKYTFLDEPDSFLSRKNKSRFLSTLEYFKDDRSIVIITHDDSYPFQKLLDIEID